MNTENIFSCDACDKFRTSEQLSNSQSDFWTCAYPVICDSPSPYEACAGCDEIDLAENLINGGEYEPETYRCHDCQISHLEALRDARLEEQEYRRNN